VGVDLGGTKSAVALVGPDGSLGPRLEEPTPAGSGPDAVLDVVSKLVLAAAGDESLAGVGVGTAGIVDGSGRVVSATDTFADWVGTDLVAGLRHRLPDAGPIAVINDVDAHLLGEAWLGAARGWTSAVMVAVGTGVGGAVLVNGRLWRGHRFAAGEIGHIPVPGAEGRRCPCGRAGHLEALAAGPAMERAYHQATGAAIDGRQLFARASSGDPTAAAVVRAGAEGLGRAIAGLITAFDPEGVVIGGGVARSGAIWWEPLVATCRSELVSAFHGIRIEAAELGPDAAILGAAKTAIERTPIHEHR
jgi:glucokinase